jgi:hypothetical protein
MRAAAMTVAAPMIRNARLQKPVAGVVELGMQQR